MTTERSEIIRSPAFTAADLADLARAKQLLENPAWTAKLVNLIGMPVERALGLLPQGWTKLVHKSAQKSLSIALSTSLKTLKAGSKPASNKTHSTLAALSGGLGGAIGFLSLPLELPLSTMIILRSIADVARSEGHDLTDPATRMACLEVFALGGRTETENAAESAYWTIRAGLAQVMQDAAKSLAQKGLAAKTTPAVTKLLSTLATRFGIVVSEETAAKAVPVVGAAGGAVVNLFFIQHFQQMSRGHFIVKRLEKTHGKDAVEAEYRAIKS